MDGRLTGALRKFGIFAVLWLSAVSVAEAALIPATSSDGKAQTGICWVMMAVFVIGTLAVAFKTTRGKELSE